MTVVKFRTTFGKNIFEFCLKNSKMPKNVFFEAKNHKKFDKMVLSWPREMVDSLKNQKKIVQNDSKKYFWWKKDWPKIAEKRHFLI